jgi:hypothetical protein
MYIPNTGLLSALTIPCAGSSSLASSSTERDHNSHLLSPKSKGRTRETPMHQVTPRRNPMQATLCGVEEKELSGYSGPSTWDEMGAETTAALVGAGLAGVGAGAMSMLILR